MILLKAIYFQIVVIRRLVIFHPLIYLLFQEKVYQEILTTLTNKTSSTNPFTTRSLNSMKYLEACIKEALRLYPSVPFIARCLTEDVQLQDYLLPMGTEAIIVLYNLHRDPKVFQRPEIYDPDRFMTSAAERSPYAYIPFSAGPRNCIGEFRPLTLFF